MALRKVLITGGSGLLGKYLLTTQPRNDAPEGVVDNKFHVIPTYRNNPIKGGIYLDVSDPLKTLFEVAPDIIIHCAANGDVDSVEKNPSRAVKSDLLGTINLLDYAHKLKCHLITISTNAVYDGTDAPYDSDAPHSPVNFYGKLKSMADEIVIHHDRGGMIWQIVRPIFMYGWNYPWGRDNWATRIIDKLKRNEPVRLVTNSYTQPTYAGDVAEYIWWLIANTGPTTWYKQHNISSGIRMSLYEFGLTVARVFGLNERLIEPAKLSDFNIAKRPIDTSFKTKQAGLAPEIGLEKMKNET